MLTAPNFHTNHGLGVNRLLYRILVSVRNNPHNYKWIRPMSIMTVHGLGIEPFYILPQFLARVLVKIYFYMDLWIFFSFFDSTLYQIIYIAYYYKSILWFNLICWSSVVGISWVHVCLRSTENHNTPYYTNLGGVCEMDQPVCCRGRRNLEVPSQAPCIPAQVQWPCWAGGVAGQPEEEEPLLAHQSEEYLSEQLRNREHL